MKKINFEAGTQISPAKVTIDNVEHNVTPAVWEGNTPLSPFVLNKMQDNIEEEITASKTTEVSEALTIENCAPVSAKLDIKNGKTIQEGEPSSDNIIPIRNVGDNINKCNLGNETFSKAGLTSIVNGSEWKISGTSTESNYLRTDFISLGKFKAGNYTFKITNTNIKTTNIAFILKDIVSNKTISSTSVKNKIVNFTLEEETELGVNIWNNGIGNVINGTIYLKLEQGSISTPYTPYNAGTMNFQLSNEDNSQSRIVSFPFTEGQVLHKGDYLASDGIHQKRKTTTISGTSATLSDAKQNGNYLCSQKVAGTLSGQTITFDTSVTDAVVEYELAKEIVIPYTTEQEEAYYELQHLLMYEDYTSIECIEEIKPDIQLTYWYNNELNKSYGERFDKVEDSINELEKGEIYSTEEQVIGRWIDGKPIYRKVINFGALPNNTQKIVMHNIENIDFIVSCLGYAMNSSGSGIALPSNNGTINTNLYATRQQIGVVTTGDRSSFTTCYITLEYTKTTD